MGHLLPIIVLDDPVTGQHAVADGHPLGCQVVVADDGIYLVEAQNMKSVLFTGPGRFDGIPPAPTALSQQIADFRHPPVPDRLPSDTALADQLPRFPKLHSPQSEAIFPVTGLLAVKPFPRLFIAEGVGIRIHHLRIL